MSDDERVGHREQLKDFIESYRNETCLWKTTYAVNHRHRLNELQLSRQRSRHTNTGLFRQRIRYTDPGKPVEIDVARSLSEDSERATSISGRVRPKLKKKSLTEDVLKSVNEHFKRPKPPDNCFEVFGKNVGMTLQELSKQQRIIAEKIINDTLFLAEMGSLTISHTVIKYDDFANTSFSTQPHIQNFSSQLHIQNLSTQPQIQNLSTKSHTQVINTQPHTQDLFTQPHTLIIYTQPHTQSSMEFSSPVEPDHTQSDNTITSYLRNFNDE
ncbi:hypothetical protein HF086_002964 [Spodoptera exigua]|uniref:MADF domain-containing protein n=1 Tax=Spodoptera exigua TaxID=7107 RepID=A0A922MYK9_SPOEX|nr:hypothetical protein HF086_002964 [Spodoptera exigua]